MGKKKKIEQFTTTYCYKVHDVITGWPIDHDCIVIPPEALQAELNQDLEEMTEIIIEDADEEVVSGMVLHPDLINPGSMDPTLRKKGDNWWEEI